MLEHLEALKRSLAEQMSQAVLKDDHPTLQRLSEVAKLTSQLHNLLNTLDASASQTEPISSSPSVRPQQGEYPRFQFDGQQLIKTAWSKKKGSEYEHAVGQEMYRKILARLNCLAEERNAFTSEQVESMTEELACPAYQMYLVLGFLRKKKLVTSERKGRYRFSPDFASEAEQAWPRESGALGNGTQHDTRFHAQQQLSEQEQAIVKKPVSDLKLSVRAGKCLERLGINTLGDLIKRTRDELLESKNFGMTSLSEVREKLATYGLTLRGD